MAAQHSVYSAAIIARKVTLAFSEVGNDIETGLAERLAEDIEGRCIVEGFVRPGTVAIQAFSAGVLDGARVSYQVQAKCDVCCPTEGMKVECVVKNVTKAGIRADSADESPSPIVCFIARDHHSSVTNFNKINEGDIFQIRFLGQRFELNDKQISIIGELMNEKEKENKKQKPTLKLLD